MGYPNYFTAPDKTTQSGFFFILSVIEISEDDFSIF